MEERDVHIARSERQPWIVRIYRADGVVVGAGVLIDQRRVLTCAHVVNAALEREHVATERPTKDVLFDFVEGRGTGRVCPDGWFPARQDGRDDVAILELASDAPSEAKPAPLRRSPRLRGHRFAAIGFPVGHDDGIWVDGEISRPIGAAYEHVQLEGVRVTGSNIQRGFSGAAVWDEDVQAVVGIIVDADRQAQSKVASMIPMQVVGNMWPDLTPLIRSWQMWDEDDVLTHWSPRARGVERDARSGWYFTGRTQILGELVSWLEEPRLDGRIRVLTGKPGVGKSALLARLVTMSNPRYIRTVPSRALEGILPPLGSIDVAVHARGKRLSHVLAAVGRAAESDAGTADLLIESLIKRGRRFTVVIDALDEADEPIEIAAALLQPLAADGANVGIRVLVGTRHVFNRELRRALGSGAVVIDVGAPPYLQESDLHDYVYRRLLASEEPTVRGWYADNDSVTTLIAKKVARRAYPTFLVAQLVSRSFMEAQAPVHDRGRGWEERLPDTVPDAMDYYLSHVHGNAQRIRDLLKPLAYAHGEGLPADLLWAHLAAACSNKDYVLDDVRELIDTGAADFLESSQVGGQITYRLYHEALGEALKRYDDQQAMQQRYAQTLLAFVPVVETSHTRNWSDAHEYVTRHLSDHAADAGLLNDLVTDPGYLLAADPERLVPRLASVSADARRHADVYMSALHQLGQRFTAESASYLELYSRQRDDDELTNAIGKLKTPWWWLPKWAKWDPPPIHRVISTEKVWPTLGVVELEGRPVLVTGGSDGSLRIWNLATGSPISEPLIGHGAAVSALAVLRIGDVPVAISGALDGSLRVWDLSDGTSLNEFGDSQGGPVRAVAVAEVGGRHLAALGDQMGAVKILDLDSQRLINSTFATVAGPVRALAMHEVNGQGVIVGCGSWDAAVHVWDVSTGDHICEPLVGHDEWLNGLAITSVEGEDVIVSGGFDRTVRLWDVATGRQRGPALLGHEGGVNGLTTAELARRPVAASCSSDGTIMLWDLVDSAPLYHLSGHTSSVSVVAIVEVDGRPLVISAGADRTLRLWDLMSSVDLYDRLSGQSHGGVRVVKMADLGNRPVVLSGHVDGTIRLWDLPSGHANDQRLSVHEGLVTALTVAELDTRPVVVSGDSSGTIELWDLIDRVPMGEAVKAHDLVQGLAVTEIGGRQLVLSAGMIDGKLALRDLRTGFPRRAPRLDYEWWLHKFAVGDFGGKPVVSVIDDMGRLRVLYIEDGSLAAPRRRQAGWFTAVAMANIGKHNVIICGLATGSVWLWDLAIGSHFSRTVSAHRGVVNVVAAAELDGKPVVISGGNDGAVRFSNLDVGSSKLIDLESVVGDFAIAPGTLVVGTARGLVTLSIPALSPLGTDRSTRQGRDRLARG